MLSPRLVFYHLSLFSLGSLQHGPSYTPLPLSIRFFTMQVCINSSALYTRERKKTRFDARGFRLHDDQIVTTTGAVEEFVVGLVMATGGFEGNVRGGSENG